MKTIVYLSGPMTGLPDLNFPAFHQAAARLRASGYTVINPAEMDEAEAGVQREWHEYLRRDIRVLVDCTHIAMLPGWEKSKGARLERHIAQELGMGVIFVGHFSAPAQQEAAQA
jgi:thioesterase domain-containing protein